MAQLALEGPKWSLDILSPIRVLEKSKGARGISRRTSGSTAANVGRSGYSRLFVVHRIAPFLGLQACGGCDIAREWCSSPERFYFERLGGDPAGRLRRVVVLPVPDS
jgi:hypothetical protein